MTPSQKPLVAAAIGTGLALIVVAVWCGRRPRPAESVLDATTTIRVVRHDAAGVPGKPLVVRDASRVRAVVGALGIDGHAAASCPPDYAAAELGLHLGGRDVYARRDVYVWSLAGEPTIVTVSSSGCRSGAPASAAALREALANLR